MTAGALPGALCWTCLARKLGRKDVNLLDCRRCGKQLGSLGHKRRGDLTALADNILTDSTQAMGHHTRFAVAAGTPLRGDMLRVPHAVRQGQTVPVVSAGPGFRVSSEGRAMNNAAPGESVRVRLANGQVVTGVAQPGGTVEVSF